MTALAEHSLAQATVPAVPRSGSRLSRSFVILIGLAVVNATLFMVIRPGVNDLWAARARASAAAHGVGLTYWFAWFGGGSTPGNYSVLTPYLSAVLSAELVGALAAVSITVLARVAVRGTPHPVAATAVAALAAGINLWSGRVPFLLGSAIAIGSLIAVRNHRRVIAAALTMLCILASPVSAAFLALGLAGTLVVSPKYRIISATTVGTVVAGFGLVALVFGTPGPQHFSWTLCIESIVALGLFLLARPPDYLRVVIWLSMFTSLAIAVVPNGLGSNFSRMIWFCLPVAVVATFGRRLWVALLVVGPVLISSANLTVADLRDASDPVAGSAYYQPLVQELDRIDGLNNFRLEVVAEGAHAAYDALLDHAMLARGWETQEDNALNATLLNRSLSATSYKVWLDNNSVGYVALPKKVDTFPEYALVAAGRLPYLHEVWSSSQWVLYRVDDPTPIVAVPQTMLDYSQSKLTIRSTCTCTFSVRVRFSKYLRADLLVAGGGTAHGTAQNAAKLTDDGYGFTSMSTPSPGDYVLHGTVAQLFH